MNYLSGLSKIILLLLATVLFLYALVANSTGRIAYQLVIDDVIDSATEDYIASSLAKARLQQAELVIIRMNTPGGLDAAMHGIIKNITNSVVPVVTYITPTGSRTSSAGRYILYASHIAAMAPGTYMDPETSVKSIHLSALQASTKDYKQHINKNDIMQKQTINDAVAYLQSLAKLHGRNPGWAEKAAIVDANLQANEALRLNVIDVVALTMRDLLAQINGRTVSIQGSERTLNTLNLIIREVSPDWRSRFLSVISNPNVAYILMLLGIYALILEFSTPGAIVPGTVGAIALLLAIYAFQVLPISYIGMGLIVLGLALMIAEAYKPRFAILGIGGVVSFITGSIRLIDTDIPGFKINLVVIITFSIISVLFFVFIFRMAIKARHKPVVSGVEELLGSEAVVLPDFDKNGRVAVHGESWQAICNETLSAGQVVKIVSIEGLVLSVKPSVKTIEE